MHSHMYLAEANVPPVSPAVVAGRQCLLADPALTVMTIALKTWSLPGT